MKSIAASRPKAYFTNFLYLHVHEKTYTINNSVDFTGNKHAGDQGTGLLGGLHLPGNEDEGLPVHPFRSAGRL